MYAKFRNSRQSKIELKEIMLTLYDIRTNPTIKQSTRFKSLQRISNPTENAILNQINFSLILLSNPLLNSKVGSKSEKKTQKVTLIPRSVSCQFKELDAPLFFLFFPSVLAAVARHQIASELPQPRRSLQ